MIEWIHPRQHRTVVVVEATADPDEKPEPVPERDVVIGLTTDEDGGW